MIATFAATSAYAEVEPVGLDVATVTSTTSNALEAISQQALPLEDFEDFSAAEGDLFSTGNTVQVEGTQLVTDVGVELRLDLPIDPDTPGVVADDGSVVHLADGGLATQVQSIDGGPVRVLTVADETYSDNAVHEYSYRASLPDSAELLQLADGQVVVVQRQDEVTDQSTEAFEPTSADLAELSELLFEQQGVSVDDVAAESAPLEEGVPEGYEVVAAFQNPWAVDADGVELPTSYRVEGDELIQVVDTSAAAFPVVADPAPLVGIAIVGLGRILLGLLFRQGVTRAFSAVTIRAGTAFTTRGGFRTFDAFKKHYGAARKNYQWHHIVEQRTAEIRGWSSYGVNHPNTLVMIPTKIHQSCVNSWMAKNGVRKFGVHAANNQTMRAWVRQQSWSKQHAVGVALLKYCGVAL